MRSPTRQPHMTLASMSFPQMRVILMDATHALLDIQGLGVWPSSYAALGGDLCSIEKRPDCIPRFFGQLSFG